MSQDDDVNEKALDAAVHALVRHGGTDPNDEDGPYSAFVETMTPPVRAAITAYLSALPERELLADALEALEPFVRFEQKGLRIIDDEMMRDELTIDGFFNSWNFEPFPTYGDLRRARAAADKIRAALGGGQ